ncbi:MAG TPA: ABC transporter substrate-binding protein [Candidatus Paceibacterota bacterium]|nr:ABC transporter substrate-binding protein [Candidatus Paceibacterota bacterium]
MKEKISILLKKEFNIPIPGFLRHEKLKFIFQDLPKKDELLVATKTFSKKERLFFWTFAFLFCSTGAFLLWDINKDLMIERPVKGGEIVEGVADMPRFINPLLATGMADADITSLVYSGLLRPGPNGEYINDLAESYTVSKDGLVYNFKIRENATWHDGKPVTADDVLFTIQKAKDVVLRSPKRASWEGVTALVISEKEIQMTLKQPFQSFLENATMGILPKHKWNNIDSDKFALSYLNMRAIGSGPYKVKTISKRTTDDMPEYIELIPFREFALGEPKISKITIHFYQNQEELYTAYKKGTVTSMSSPSPKFVEELKNSKTNIIQSSLPRIYAIFFNPNESKLLADKEVRRALDMAIDKKGIIDNVLLGYGTIIKGPIPPDSLGFTETNNAEASTTPATKIAEAQKILAKLGWKKNEKTGILEKKISKKETQVFEVSISTTDFTELKTAAGMVKADWEKLGAKVNLQIFEKGDLDRNVIEPRKYDSLFFGEIVGRDLDLFSFWHSSQKKNPGVNVSMYSNTKVDKILESLKAERDNAKKIKLLKNFQTEIDKDIPASFIYSPNFIYLLPKEVKNVNILPPVIASDRFLNVYEWYINTEKIWKIFQ